MKREKDWWKPAEIVAQPERVRASHWEYQKSAMAQRQNCASQL